MPKTFPFEKIEKKISKICTITYEFQAQTNFHNQEKSSACVLHKKHGQQRNGTCKTDLTGHVKYT